MYFRVREFEIESKYAQQWTLETLRELLPLTLLHSVLEECHCREQRFRRLSSATVVVMLVLMGLYTWEPISAILRKLLHAACVLADEAPVKPVNSGAIAYRREQLGVRPMAELFHRICQPMATEKTRGAFLFGMRVLALDGHVEDVPDTPANASYFGRHKTNRGESVYPQVHAVYLCEVGTRAIIDAGFWPCHTSEHTGARRLLRSVPEGSLLMFDRGLHDFRLFEAAQEHHFHILARLSSVVKVKLFCRLPDGTHLGWLYMPHKLLKLYKRRGILAKHVRRKSKRVLVRVIEYVITHPDLPGYGEIHRLITTLLNPQSYPAQELILAYHERWEVETTIDEISTHQRLAQHPLRSRTPWGVLQEFYGLLIAHYLIRKLIHQAALSQDIDPDRISFSHAFRVLTDTLPLLSMGLVLPVKLSEWVDAVMEWLVRAIAVGTLPDKRFRAAPRKVKRANQSKFPAKQRSDPPALKVPGTFSEAVALI